MTIEDVLAAMERVVSAATQAKWRAGRMDMVSYEAHGGAPFKNLYVDDPNGEMHLGHRLPRTIARAEGDNCLADAAMIAMFDPPTLTALLAVARAAQELDDILSDPDARREIDSFTGQPLHNALDALTRPPQGAGG